MATLDELLTKTSRTFALAIPLLPEPERLDVTLGYLVFRIADTFEDAENLSRDQRIASLEQFVEVLDQLTPESARRFGQESSHQQPSCNADYNQLLLQTGDVIAALADRPPVTREIVVKHAQQAASGMIATLRQADASGSFEFQQLQQLRDYCYYVAGVVGEMLTELFQQRLGESPLATDLRRHARWFGEGLQLVNILKDAPADAEQGRTYLPTTTPREEVLTMARDDLQRAACYIEALEQASAPAGYLAFTRLPRELAVATLDKLEADGPGAKLTRPEVSAILESVQRTTFESSNCPDLTA